ncbi:N-acetyl-D-glucosamine kinase [Lutzomyia longipalpis]|uniref:N-acetyl-D-glucosamine kinase n=1 Tax=Lutzomyia longipalpis TaxID=7200 RepID=UPI002483E18D|nr:N-acetyl-D-glucosamine kinase [Lutzomyia longipalpis]
MFFCRNLCAMTSTYIGGVEGGATHSKLIICDETGGIVASVVGPGTNHWMVGIPECARRIAEMATKAKSAANIPQTLKLKCLGLSLSGCEQEATNKGLEAELKNSCPSLAENYVVCSDTVGSIATVSPLGGLVLISGTGSNALLRNPDGSVYNCGGWGHIMGDEGSAWWISHRAMKIVFDDQDNFVKSVHPTNTVWQLMKEHFSVETRLDLLDHCYAKFDKPFFAGLCLKLAKAANDGDRLCQQLFMDAGKLLAKSIIALLPRVSEELVRSGELSIVCVGSVWMSWDLLKMGFIKEMNTTSISYGLTLKRLTQNMALGATYLAADAIEFNLPRDYAKNYEVFYKHHNTAAVNGNGIE